jgi:hypothetical protein
MRRGAIRTVFRGALAALLAIFIVLPFAWQHRCEKRGGQFDRATLRCVIPTPGRQ